MINEEKLLELQEKNILKKGLKDQTNYIIFSDKNILSSLDENFKIDLWKSGMITITNSHYKIFAELNKNRLFGQNSKKHYNDIKKAIENFKVKHKELLLSLNVNI